MLMRPNPLLKNGLANRGFAFHIQIFLELNPHESAIKIITGFVNSMTKKQGKTTTIV
jgi:hypothetical protein